jgi:hypothetical protein
MTLIITQQNGINHDSQQNGIQSCDTHQNDTELNHNLHDNLKNNI